jgi:ATP-dependent RNA helicase DbpA
MNFADVDMNVDLLRAVDAMGFATMTPVQAQALPPMLAGKDVIAQARTGSGKTVAFGLSLLARVNVKAGHTQALVLCPTRELAEQVSGELRKLGKFMPNLRVVTLCGGVPARTQVASLQTTPHVIVGTPGRVLDHLGRTTIDVGAIDVLVLDEADRMLDMGFADDIGTVVQHTPQTRQTHLFSATFPAPIRALSHAFQTEAVAITVDGGGENVDVEQRYFDVSIADKLKTLHALLLGLEPPQAMVFCHTRNDVRDVAAQLARLGWACAALHGELEQRERDEVLLRFANGSVQVLVATDVAARGLDIKGISAVISWELPTDPDMHVHRIGRTGRAGRKGLAMTLVAPSERTRLLGDAQALSWLLPPATTGTPPPPAMTTLLIDGGKRHKLRAGDVLGALTKDAQIPGAAVGKIDVGVERSYVAVAREHAQHTVQAMADKPMKGRLFRVRILGAGRS